MENTNGDRNVYLPVNIRALRKRQSWSQEELADKIGLNRGNIASYENGSAEPKICNLVKIAHLFKLSVFDLTHSNLQDESTFKQATGKQQNGHQVIETSSLQHYFKEAEDFQNAFTGLQCLFRLNSKNAGELPEEMQFLQKQFEQLHSVAEHLLESHMKLLQFIKSKCGEDGKGCE